jgi:hypothetical protein
MPEMQKDFEQDLHRPREAIACRPYSERGQGCPRCKYRSKDFADQVFVI